MFALAELTARDTVAGAAGADSLRRLLIERYPDSEFAAVARRILGLAPVESRSDTSGRLYAQAEALYLEGRHQEAIAGFQEIADRFPASDDAARAQYAIGFIYENHIGLNDSAEVHYRAVAKSYPRTEFAANIQPKLLALDQERKEMEAARRRDSVAAAKTRDSLAAALRMHDSLAAIGGAQADSLKAPKGAAALPASPAPKDTAGTPPPTKEPGQGTPPDTTRVPPGEETERPREPEKKPPSEPPPSEPAPGNPPPESPPETPGGEPPPGEEPSPPPPDITRPGFR
jgi:outer membrane protein assembly factor BamD (BamD/ComL family)